MGYLMALSIVCTMLMISRVLSFVYQQVRPSKSQLNLLLRKGNHFTTDARRWWYEELGSPKFVCAPMVDQSALAFRQLVRRYGVDLAYSPMLNCRVVAQGKAGYLSSQLSTREDDSPLAIQLAGSESDIVKSAVSIILQQAQPWCPQRIASKGNYGAFLFERDLPAARMVVKTLVEEFNIRVSVKIRLLQDTKATIQACQQLVDVGACLVTVHGRNRLQNKQLCGAADWEAMTQVLNALKSQVPLIANGGVSSRNDAFQLLDLGFDAVMSSEALLDNPALFYNSTHPSRRDLCSEYLDIFQENKDIYNDASPFSFVRAHTFKFLHGSLSAFPEIRNFLAEEASCVDDVRYIIARLDQLDPERKFDLIGSSKQDHPSFDPRLSWYFRYRLDEIVESSSDHSNPLYSRPINIAEEEKDFNVEKVKYKYVHQERRHRHQQDNNNNEKEENNKQQESISASSSSHFSSSS